MKAKLILLLSVLTLFMSGCATNAYLDGLAAYSKKDYDTAMKNFKYAWLNNMIDPNYNFMIGKTYCDKGYYNDAVLYLKRVSELEPGSDYYRWLGHAYLMNGQHEEALAAYKSSLSYSNDNSVLAGECHAGMAKAYDAMGHHDRALSEIEQAIILAPSNAVNYTGLSYLLEKIKQYEEAIRAARKAIEIEPDNAVAYNNMAHAYSSNGQYDEAVRYYKKALAINPKYTQSYKGLSYIYSKLNRHDDAVSTAREGLEHKPENTELLHRLSSALYSSGSYENSLATIDKAVEFCSITGIGVDVKSDTYRSFWGWKDGYLVKKVIEGMPAAKEDIRIGDIIIKIDNVPTESLELHDVLNRMQKSKGSEVALIINRSDKGEMFDKLINYETLEKRIVRDTKILKEAAPYLEFRARIKRKLGRTDEAMQDAMKAHELDPSQTLALGALQFDGGRYREAIDTLKDNDDVAARVLVAAAYAKLGRTEDAIKAYSEISEEERSSIDVPLRDDYEALNSFITPLYREYIASAEKCRSRGDYAAALDEYAEALPIASGSDEEQGLIKDIFATVREMPNPPALPEKARRCTIRGDLLLEEGDFKGAAVEYRKAIRCAPYIARLYAQTALICEKMEDYPEAKRYMELYVQAAPDAPDARAAKDAIIKWEMMMERGGK